MKFKVINCPRNKDGGFGLQRCDRCKGKSTAYVEIEFKEKAFKVVLCKGCLLEGVDHINTTMLNDCINKGKH
jgi:hypothetical protein